MAIYVFGSIAYDRIMNFDGKFADHILPDKIHMLNVCFFIERLEEKLGGTAGNIAHSLALLGEKPTVLSTVGKDFDRYKKVMEEQNLPLDGIRVVDDLFTASAHITTDQSDNQITGFHPGAMIHPCNYEFPTLSKENDIAIISPGNKDDMMNLPKYFRENGIRYIFDPGQQITIFSGEEMLECIEGAHMLVSNDYELELIKSATGLSKEQLLEKCDYIITTLAENGSRIDNGSPIEVGIAKPTDVVDPTGCGDAFRAGLLKGIVDGKSVEESAKLGAVCASYCVEKYGTREHSFTQDEFEARFAEAFSA
ncbi:carbohydrate kinase family protein [Halodesulfovibrio sp.]|jgi:adenosine kinase|uniref:carbohydrate kinase family protein n=1 Tax=Halodesulfovibrio sp. TaxID=1912772 RepID=UPI0026006255|nr:carbohydrate kinase family protein [Halodesulfovibrio sp.]MCT4536083.1 carbohydrate kinase family protein [Halodesulfovibrio sp.]MCT4626726.1 carbohydrate kinase family protein [Halodesulfovibrio sp.]